MGLTIEVISEDIVAAAEWQSFRYAENIGQPDEMSVDAIGFTVDPIFAGVLEARMANPNNYFYTVVRLGSDVLFSGLIRNITMQKPAVGAMKYGLQATGWAFLLPRRLVGAPTGDLWWADQTPDGEIPEFECVDPPARWYIAPTPAGVRALFQAYWTYIGIDYNTYVTDILPDGAAGDEMSWSGSDMEAVLNDLAAAGSASAMWWFGNDGDSVNLMAPGLALHFGIVIIPDEGDDGNDLAAGLPSADLPENVAPYEISDEPDWATSILPLSSSFQIDHTQRASGTYVRGATGFVLDVLPNPNEPVGYSIAGVQIGGTGWVGQRGGIWGEEYVDAAAAVTMEQRDAFGNAFLASRENPGWTGTITVGGGFDGWHKGQAIAVTDADYGFDHRWFLIRGVSMSQKDPYSIANEYTLTVGDVLSPSLGWALRQRRLADQRKEVDPGQKFTVYHGDLLLDPADPDNITSKIEGQFATASGTARKVKGVGATWHLWINGVDQGTDIHNHGSAYFLHAAPSLTTTTDEAGKVYGVLEAGASALSSDAADISIDVVLP